MPEILFPCPFCGSSDIEIHAAPAIGDDEWIAHADCIDCGASGPRAEGYTQASGEQAAAEQAAAAAWNERAAADWNERRIMPTLSAMRRLAEEEA